MSSKPPEIDPEVRQLFIEEAEQKAGEICRGIAEWNEQPESLDRMVWLQMRFAEYSGIATTLGLQRSGQSCAVAVDELTQVIGGARPAEDSLAILFERALKSIDYAVEYLHGDEIDASLIFDAVDDEPTVAQQLPTLNFPDIQTGKIRPQPDQAPQINTAANNILVQLPPVKDEHGLFDVFMDEAQELLELGDAAWHDWNSGQHSDDAIKELRRVFHTLKGGAKLTQMSVLGDYVHHAEDWMDDAGDATKADALKQRTRFTLDQLQSAFANLSSGNAAALEDSPNNTSELSAAPASQPAQLPSNLADPATQKPKPASGKNFVRVRTQLLETLRLRASEVTALRNQMQQIATAMQTEQRLTTQTLGEANTTLRQARFSLERLIDKLPTEHIASLSDTQLESQMALQAMEDVLLRLNRQTDRSLDLSSHVERALNGQSKAAFSLQEHILNTRLVPFSDFESRLNRIVRQSADSLGKKAALKIDGLKVDVDRNLLEQLLPALEHMLRNALAHGIEPSEERRETGKPAVGSIRIALRKTRGKVELEMRDDGAGIAMDKIKQKAISLGLISADDQLDERSLNRLIFHPGLSAADQLDQLSGRGVGMDVVEHIVHELGGNIDVSSTTGEGTRFILRLPMGESALNAIIVNIGDELYAVPQQDICSIQRLDDQTLSRGYQENAPLAWDGKGWTVQSLGHWLGLDAGSLPGPRRSLPALLVETEQENFAVVVDHCSGSSEYNLETLPAAVTGILGISGAIILEDGQVAPVLDLPALCGANVHYPRPKLQLAAPDPSQRFKVMLVEDSNTWQRQLTRGLSRYPFDLTVCKDGQEALSMLENAKPQLLIVDLEMPRMDGLEFLRRLRRNTQHSNVPAIMFSTVTGTTQRNRARQLGAKAWVNKNANLHPLITEIDRQLGTQFARHEADPNVAS